MKQQLIFTFERETPGALRYYESDAMGTKMQKNYLVGTLYIRKSEVEGTPQKLNVTVETA